MMCVDTLGENEAEADTADYGHMAASGRRARTELFGQHG